MRQETGEAVPVPEETDYFERAGLPYIEPTARTVRALRQAARRPDVWIADWKTKQQSLTVSEWLRARLLIRAGLDSDKAEQIPNVV